MKIWTSEHTFEHPWDTVVTAAQRKYPNPMNPSVVGLDVVDREVRNDGILRSHRLMSTEWGMPEWVSKLVGVNRACFISEHSEVNPRKKTMTLRSRNLTFSHILTVEEDLVYEQHPDNPSWTRLKQAAVITVSGVPLSDYMEKLVTDNCSKNAGKGRKAMEWVIDKVKGEAKDLGRVAHDSIEAIEAVFNRGTAV